MPERSYFRNLILNGPEQYDLNQQQFHPANVHRTFIQYSHEALTPAELADLPIETPKQWGRALAAAMAHEKPSVFFKVALNNGKLKKFFGELYACVGCQQDPRFHADDVFEHIMQTLDAARQHTSDLTTLLAALFHDIGKPVVRREVK